MPNMEVHSADGTQCADAALIRAFIEGEGASQEEPWRATRLAACIRGSRMFHISGLIVGPACLLYRKCYLSGAIFVACYLLALALGGPLFGLLAALCLNAAISIAFVPLYQRRFRKAMGRATCDASSEQVERTIRKAGGVSFAAAVIALVILGIAVAISLLLLFDEIFTFLEVIDPESYLYIPEV